LVRESLVTNVRGRRVQRSAAGCLGANCENRRTSQRGPRLYL
jgi:hypothetical protein